MEKEPTKKNCYAVNKDMHSKMKKKAKDLEISLSDVYSEAIKGILSKYNDEKGVS